MQRIAVLILCAALAACGGGSKEVPPAPSDAQTPAKTAARAHFTITIPPKSAQAKPRKPQYVSTNTQSVVITLNSVNGTAFSGPQAETAVNLTPSNPACSGSPLTCSVAVPAAAGSDSFTVNTYDAPQTSTSPATPAGNLLSSGAVAVNVVAGQANSPSTPLVLDGIAASVVASFPSDQHISANGTTTYLIVGSGQFPLTITPLDASGAQIIGPGAPTFTLASGSSAVVVTSTGPNAYNVQAQQFNVNPVTLTISPTSGTAPSNTLAITTVQELWVANYQGHSVTGYALAGVPYQITDDTIPIGGGCHPTSVAVDASGNLWVAVSETNSITGFSLGTSPSPTGVAVSTTQSAPINIAFDTHGQLWAATLGGDVEAFEVVPASAAGQISAYTMPANFDSINQPTAVAFDANDELWVANSGNPNVTAYTIPPHPIPGNTITETSANVPNYGLTFDSSGNLWISNWNNASVSEYTPGSNTPILGISGLNGGPEGLVFDASGNLWVASSAGGITSTGTVVEFAAGAFTSPAVVTITAGLNSPAGIALAP